MNKKLLLFFVFMVFFLYTCTTNKEKSINTQLNAPDSIQYQKINDIFIYESSIGNENLPDEFLLDKISFFYIGENDDVYISDEFKIKVFDRTGKPLFIFGRKGEGPCDFDNSPQLNVSNNKYIIAKDLNFISIIDRAEKKLLSKNRTFDTESFNKYFDREGISKKSTMFLSVPPYYVSDKIFIYNYAYNDNEKDVRQILYEKNGIINIIDECVNNKYFIYGLIWSQLINPELFVYAKTDELIENKKGEHYYIIHLLNLNTMENKKYLNQYTPVEYTFEYRESDEKVREYRLMPYKYDEEAYKAAEKRLEKETNAIITLQKKVKYRCPVFQLFADKKYIYVIVEKYIRGGSKYYLDIFDIETKKFLKSVLLPFMPNCLKNGYAYEKDKDSNGYPVIKKYKINPAVYGK